MVDTLPADSLPREARIPPGPRLPRPVPGPALLASRRQTMHLLRRRYGPAVSLDAPFRGQRMQSSLARPA